MMVYRSKYCVKRKKRKKRLQILCGVQDFYSFPEQRIKGVTLSSTNCFSSLLTLELHKAVCFYKRSLTVKGGKHRAPPLSLCCSHGRARINGEKQQDTTFCWRNLALETLKVISTDAGVNIWS